MAEQTIRGQMATALEGLDQAFDHKHWPIALAGARTVARLALDRHRAEPEGTVPCEKCRGTGDRHVAGEPTQEPCGECSGEGVVCKPEEPCHCKANECGPECPCYEAGLEAQRERVGGGRA